MLERIQAVAAQVGAVVVGKQPQIKLALACLLARGHLLIEDLPGVGKTTLAHALSMSLGLQFRRVQFTNDLLPADIVGLSVFDRDSAKFVFHPGPVFSQVLLADEINRASPKTQSALLEAMEERQVSVDGTTHRLPPLFFVIATQNPLEQRGVYALPEAQLDRFTMKISLGHPAPADELRVLEAQRERHPIEALEAVATREEILALRAETRRVHVDAEVSEYAVRLVGATRRHPEVLVGGSPRASLALVRLGQAQALLGGESYVVPDAIKQLAAPVLRHRLILRPQARISGLQADQVIADVLSAVDVPLGR